jgi:hypothetical protein
VSSKTTLTTRHKQLMQYRFIPNRAGQDLQASFNLLHDDGSPATPSKSKRTPHNELHFQKSKHWPRTLMHLSDANHGQLKKPIGLTQQCCARRCLRTQYPKLSHSACHPQTAVPCDLEEDHTLRQPGRRVRYRHPAAPHRPLKRTSSPILASQHLQGLHRVGTGC